MSKRDRILGLVAGQSTQDYVPAAFFLHFDPAFHRGAAAIAKHEEFFRFTGMDLVKIQFELPFPQQEMRTPKDWANVPFRDIAFYEPQLEVVKGLVNKLKSEAVIVLTLYSPFMIAGQIGGEPTLIKHLQEAPEQVKPGLDAITESLMGFVRACVKAGLDGFYHSTQGREVRRFADPSVFDKWIAPIDLAVMGEIADISTFNILHVCDYNRSVYGGYDDLKAFVEFPGHVVSCDTRVGKLELTGAEVAKLFGRPFLGGMDRLGAMVSGTEQEIRAAARKAIEAGGPSFILGADCTIPGDTPWENLRIAIDEAHRGR